MLKSYEALYENGQFTWLAEQPEIETARVIVTVLAETNPSQKRRTFPVPDIGQVEILGDIVDPIVDEEDWECLKSSF